MTENILLAGMYRKCFLGWYVQKMFSRLVCTENILLAGMYRKCSLAWYVQKTLYRKQC